MDRCPVCNELVDGGLICFNCDFDNRILKTIQQFEEQNSDAEPVKQGRGIVAKSVIRRHRQKWLETQREFEFDFSYTKLRKYNGSSSTVVIPYGVEAIEGAFSKNHTIKKVVFPDSVTTIGRDAFSFCDNLEIVELPNSVTSISKKAFLGCKKLNISISQNVLTIEEGALTQVKNICVHKNNTHYRVQQDMLIDCDNGVLLATAFKAAYLDVIVPDDVKRIGYMAVGGDFVHNSIVLPNGLKHIGSCALINDTRMPFIIPKTVTSIDSGAFACNTNVSLEPGNLFFVQKNNLIIERNTNRLISVCDRNCSSVLIPSDVRVITEYAFAFCKKLSQVSIPQSVEHIESSAFFWCKNLQSITIPKSVRRMGWGVFNECTALKAIFCESEAIMSNTEVNFWKEGCNACVEKCDNLSQTYNKLSIDGMSGHDFEYYCANLLRKNGFSDVKVTKGSGDQGVDILAKKDGIKYAIQCKNYASHLGNTPVQEVNAGKIYYKCHVGVVMTNSTFTQGAKTLAEATGVLLWDGSVLTQMMENAN